MKELTRAEEQVMQYIWKLGSAFLKDIVDQFPEPRPAYTTISTVIRVLVKKEVLAYRSYGKAHEYYPLITKSDYTKGQLKSVITNFFNDSPVNFASFFAEQDDLDLSELEEIKQLIEQRIWELKNDIR